VIKGVAAPGRVQRRTDALDEGGNRGDVADVELQGDCLAPHAFDLGHDGLRAFGAAAIGEDDVAAVAGDADGGVAAKAAAAAGDDRDGAHGCLIGERCAHPHYRRSSPAHVAR
jgi:hypothetical protein